METSKEPQADRDIHLCPACGKAGKPVQGQTVKAMLAVSLREVREIEYRFCETQDCPVVYFSPDGGQIFSTPQVRERVYQKEMDNPDVLVCYCFQHKLGDLISGQPEARAAILGDINAGTRAGECACDLRNPQGSCCLGNVRALIKRLQSSSTDRETSAVP